MSVALEKPDSTADGIGTLRRTTKLAYGVGDVGAAIAAQVTGFFLTAFLLDVALLPATFVSVIVLISNLWDAVTDPLVGNLSDRTKTRWGRRRPWLLFGAVPFGLAFFAQWVVPPGGVWALAAYYLIMTLAMKTMFTVVNVPYTAMTPELTDDYDDRTALTSYRFAFSIAGGLLAVLLHDFLVNQFDGRATGFLISGAILGVFIVASAWTTFFFTRERFSAEDKDEPGVIASLRIAVGNRPFLYVVGIYLLTWLVVQFIQNNLVLYLRYWIEDASLFGRLVLVLQVTAFTFLPVWATISKRISKKGALYLGLGIFIPVLIALYFVPQGATTMLYAIVFLGGICVSMALLLPWSMLPDVVEYEEYTTGQRREGVYYGLFVFVQKIGLSLSLAASAFALGVAGYVNPETAGGFVEQPASVLLTLRLVVSIFPMILLVLAIPLVFLYPITRDKYAEIRLALVERRGNPKPE